MVRRSAGEYLDGRRYAEGFPENVEFFRLDYLDPAEIEFGLRFAEIHPLLWLRAGGIGEREALDPTKPLGFPAGITVCRPLRPGRAARLLAALHERPTSRHVFVVADSAEAFAQVASDLPRQVERSASTATTSRRMRGATR